MAPAPPLEFVLHTVRHIVAENVLRLSTFAANSDENTCNDMRTRTWRQDGYLPLVTAYHCAVLASELYSSAVAVRCWLNDVIVASTCRCAE